MPTRFTAHEIETIDRLVAEGVGENRSAVIRRAVSLLSETSLRIRTGAQIVESYRSQPMSEEDQMAAMANAIAMTEAEPW